jgi:hypothetical protein
MDFVQSKPAAPFFFIFPVEIFREKKLLCCVQRRRNFQRLSFSHVLDRFDKPLIGVESKAKAAMLVRIVASQHRVLPVFGETEHPKTRQKEEYLATRKSTAQRSRADL